MHNWERSAGFFLCLLWGFFVALNWGILAQIIDIFFPAGQRVQIPLIKKFFDEMYSIYAVLFALLWAVAQAVIGIVFEEMRRANYRGAWLLLGLDISMVLVEMGGGVYRAYLVSGGEINTMTIIAMAVSAFLSGVVPVVAIICGVISFEWFLKPVFFHEVSKLFSNMPTSLKNRQGKRQEEKERIRIEKERKTKIREKQEEQLKQKTKILKEEEERLKDIVGEVDIVIKRSRGRLKNIKNDLAGIVRFKIKEETWRMVKIDRELKEAKDISRYLTIKENFGNPTPQHGEVANLKTHIDTLKILRLPKQSLQRDDRRRRIDLMKETVNKKVGEIQKIIEEIKGKIQLCQEKSKDGNLPHNRNIVLLEKEQKLRGIETTYENIQQELNNVLNEYIEPFYKSLKSLNNYNDVFLPSDNDRTHLAKKMVEGRHQLLRKGK